MRRRARWVSVILFFCAVVSWFISQIGNKGGEHSPKVAKSNLGVGYVLKHDISLEHYVADAFVVRCFDNRFSDAVDTFLTKDGYNEVDLSSVAGGGKILASPEQEVDRRYCLRELQKSISLHHAHKVLVFTHKDCGAYGGSGRFSKDVLAEFEFHKREHGKARRVLHERFADIEVETYYVDENGIVKTSP